MLKFIIEEDSIRVRLSEKLIANLQANQGYSFTKHMSHDFLSCNICLEKSATLHIEKTSDKLSIALDDKTLDFITAKENKKEGYFMEELKLYIQADAKKKQK